MKVRNGVCIHCSGEVEWDEVLGCYVPLDPERFPNLETCAASDGCEHELDDEENGDLNLEEVIDVQ